MIIRIGIVAGDIWSYLEKHDKAARVEDIINDLQKDRDMVMMSIGWLAREGHILLEGEGSEYTAKLT